MQYKNSQTDFPQLRNQKDLTYEEKTQPIFPVSWETYN